MYNRKLVLGILLVATLGVSCFGGGVWYASATLPTQDGTWGGDWIRELYGWFTGIHFDGGTVGKLLSLNSGKNVTSTAIGVGTGDDLTGVDDLNATDVHATSLYANDVWINDTSGTPQNRTDALLYPESESTAIIWVQSGVYHLKNSRTGEVITDNNATYIWQTGVNLLSNGGLLYIRNGIYNFTDMDVDHIITFPQTTTRDNSTKIVIYGESSVWSGQNTKNNVIILAKPREMGAVFWDGVIAPGYSYNEIEFHNIQVMITYNDTVKGSNSYGWYFGRTGRFSAYSCMATTTQTQTQNNINTFRRGLTYGPMGFCVSGDDGYCYLEGCAVYGYWGGFPITAHCTLINCFTFNCAYPLARYEAKWQADHPTYLVNFGCEYFIHIINGGYAADNRMTGLYGYLTYENSTDSLGWIINDASNKIFGELWVTGHDAAKSADTTNTFLGSNTGGLGLIIHFGYPSYLTFKNFKSINALDSNLLTQLKTYEAQGTNCWDSSGNEKSATTNATWGQGKYGPGLIFDGTNKVIDLGDADLYNYSTSLSISFWVKITVGNANQRLITCRNGTTAALSGWGIETDGTGRIPNFWVSNGTATAITNSTTSLTLNNWYFIGATYDGANLILYINGIEAGRNTISGGINHLNSGKIMVGREFRGFPSIYTHMSFCDLKLYKDALTSAEMLYLSSNPT